MLAKKSSVSRLEPLAQVVVEVREADGVRHEAVEIAQVEPLAREVVDERRALGVGEHARDLRLVAPSASRARLRSRASSSSSSGNAAPEEERQARGKLDVRRAVYASPGSADFGGSRSMRNRNFGLDSRRSIAVCDCRPRSRAPGCRCRRTRATRRRSSSVSAPRYARRASADMNVLRARARRLRSTAARRRSAVCRTTRENSARARRCRPGPVAL